MPKPRTKAGSYIPPDKLNSSIIILLITSVHSKVVYVFVQGRDESIDKIRDGISTLDKNVNNFGMLFISMRRGCMDAMYEQLVSILAHEIVPFSR